jgi:hypothetical protein
VLGGVLVLRGHGAFTGCPAGICNSIHQWIAAALDALVWLEVAHGFSNRSSIRHRK